MQVRAIYTVFTERIHTCSFSDDIVSTYWASSACTAQVCCFAAL